MSDVAVERCDGLGWYFGLFFLIHAAAPGVAATVCAQQLGGENAIPLMAASVIAYLPLLLVLRGALKKKARIARIRELLATGTRTWATVTHREMLLGHAKSGGKRYRRAAVWLNVEAGGFAAHPVETRAWYRGFEIERLVPGARVPVVVAPNDPNEVVIVEVPEVQTWAAQLGGGLPPPMMVPATAEAIARSRRRAILLMVALFGAISAIASAGLIVALSFDDEAAGVLSKFFSRLEQENYDGAYALLSEDLQDEVGSPEALGERWEKARMSVQMGKLGCSRGSSSRMRVGRGATITRSKGDAPFRLGSLPYNKCSRTVTADLQKENGKMRIVALAVE